MLTQAPPATPSSDDRSGRAHRQAIGYCGLALPFVLVLIDWLRPYGVADPWLRDSISAHYYTGAVAAFVGILVALGLYLCTYRGYGNQRYWADRTFGIIAGIAAFGVALFPTGVPVGLTPVPWWGKPTGYVHYTCAIVLFSMFAVFSLWLFRQTSGVGPPAADKRRRNWIYLACGIVIVGAMIWAGVAGQRDQDIFWPESLALVAFASSWLVKGRAYTSIAETARALTRRK